jgi:nicotinate-nucleotide adenylyltransferase
MRIGLFGGSFNPVHAGHLIASRAVAEELHLDKLYLVPAAVPPHRVLKNLADARHRLEMLRLATRGEPLFEVSDLEIARPGPSYTILTVEEFRRRLGESAEFFWIIGADSLPELASWYQAERLVDICRIITAARPGWDRPDLAVLAGRLRPEQIERLKADVLQTPCIDISASGIRRRVAAGLSIRYLVPDAVADYIAAHGLYRAGNDAQSGGL